MSAEPAEPAEPAAPDAQAPEAKADSIFMIALNLAAATFFAGAIIATLNYFTEPARLANEKRIKEEAMQNVLPRAARFEPIAGFDEGYEWYFGLDAQGQRVGYVLPVRQRGYEGFIEMMLGVDAERALVEFEILKHRETPGLGAKATGERFHARFRGRKSGQLEVAKRPTPGKIQAITGATITSRAIAKAFQAKLDELAALEEDGFQTIPAHLANPRKHR